MFFWRVRSLRKVQEVQVWLRTLVHVPPAADPGEAARDLRRASCHMTVFSGLLESFCSRRLWKSCSDTSGTSSSSSRSRTQKTKCLRGQRLR